MSPLTTKQKNSFDENGFLVLPDFFSIKECDSLMSRMATIIDAANDESSTIFSTTDRTHSQEDYFLTSGERYGFSMSNKARTQPLRSFL
ncbi:MAG: hypothetical protein Ct9H90mP5_01530 [Acidimicrobiaceae bacterium]|nr:MAG: hypothetical protein Ct9H90mP5_01530 [Acidimicrobiaceae bacterium]